jgi:hypothetical protein
LCERVPGGVFRHGRVFGAPLGHEPPYKYYAESEFPTSPRSRLRRRPKSSGQRARTPASSASR